MNRNPRGERGAVSVEFAMLLPLFLILLVGGVHFGRVLSTRHRLSDAVGYATRAAAIRRITNAGAIRGILEARLGGARADCSTLNVTATTSVDPAGLSRLEVSVTCTLAAGFGQALLGPVGPDNLTVSAAMPL